LRVAYIDEVEAPSQDRNKKVEKVYYSALVKASVTKPNEPGQSLDQVSLDQVMETNALLIWYFLCEIWSGFIFPCFI
jgi:callose synthase